VVEDAGVGAAGADLGQVGLQGIDGLGHLVLGIFLHVSYGHAALLFF
jgi:hypothetical protein